MCYEAGTGSLKHGQLETLLRQHPEAEEEVPAADRPLLDSTYLFNYYFYWEGDAAAIALGYGSLYNHSASPRARYRKIFDAGVVEFVVVCDIEPGYEITVDYTDGGKNELWFPL
ncbi:MAG: SET domain-containing protein-lysine N-methyltransferase [Pseudonocardiaceae bacterium]